MEEKTEPPSKKVKFQEEINKGPREMPPLIFYNAQATQSTSTSQSDPESQDIGDIIIEHRNEPSTSNQIPIVPVRVNKKRDSQNIRAQWYRDAHRDEIKKRRRENYRKKQNLQAIASTSDFDKIELAPCDEDSSTQMSHTKHLHKIPSFLHRSLLPYSISGSRILNENLDELPMILAGDFNVNFAKDESGPLITFLQQEFQLYINNNPRESTTRYGTTIDAVFTRHLHNVTSNTFIAYFSYHRPIVTLIPSETSSSVNITEITNETEL